MLVLVEVDDRVATVTLNRPEARNAISAELHAQLDEAITDLDARDDVGCMVLTGADPAFCAGMDLKSLATELREVQKERQRGPAQRAGHDARPTTPRSSAPSTEPTVTGGLELAMCCDFLIASERARFADTHARVGVMPGGGMTIRLPQLVGLDRARRMSLTGDYIDAETAHDWGLVVDVVPHEELLARAREVAATIASIPAEYVTELRRGYDEIGALSRSRGVRRRGQMVAGVDGGALRPVAPDHRAREDRGPRPRPDRRTRRHPGVKVYTGMDPRLGLPDAVAHAQRVERLGYDGLHVAETVHDSMAVALLAAEHTQRITVRTSVTLAFARSPTLLAYAAWDLAKISGGRFELGLGTQVRQNIEDRYAVPFGEDPIGRLGDYVGAVRAAFASFASGAAPAYESPHYRVTRMQPYFNPGPDAVTQTPRIYLGGVQRKACALAGAVGDGFVSHPTNSNPALPARDLPPRSDGGRRTAGRDLTTAGFETVIGTSVITGASTDEVIVERERQRRLLAFLYSTPAYAPTLELYGWTEIGPRLRELIRHDRWDDLAAVLSDEVLDTLVPSGTFDELPGVLRSASRAWARASSCRHPPTNTTTTPSARSWPRCKPPERSRLSAGIGKMRSSVAMASTAL